VLFYSPPLFSHSIYHTLYVLFYIAPSGIEWPNLFGYELTDNKRSALVIQGPQIAVLQFRTFCSTHPTTPIFHVVSSDLFLNQIGGVSMEFLLVYPYSQSPKVMQIYKTPSPPFIAINL
jgi:hypothetical protein